MVPLNAPLAGASLESPHHFLYLYSYVIGFQGLTRKEMQRFLMEPREDSLITSELNSTRHHISSYHNPGQETLLG